MAIASQLRQTVQISNPTGPDVHNKQGWTSPVSWPARFEKTSKIIASATQEQIPINGIVFLGPDANVSLGAKLLYNGDYFRVMDVSPEVNIRGKVHHIEAMVQNWNTG